MASRPLQVVLLGIGNVGRTFLGQLREPHRFLRSQLDVVGVADSSGLLPIANGTAMVTCLNAKKKLHRLDALPGAILANDVASWLEQRQCESEAAKVERPRFTFPLLQYRGHLKASHPTIGDHALPL